MSCPHWHWTATPYGPLAPTIHPLCSFVLITPHSCPSLEMSDSLRQKAGSRALSRGTNSQNTMSPHSTRDFSPRANLEAQITASPSPVTSAKDARSWLENKGWILSSEDSSGAKLSDILLAATLSFKLPADACTAI